MMRKERRILLSFSLERSYMSLNLNYQPEVVVVTENLSREDWLNYRRLGIGGVIVLQLWAFPHFAQNVIYITIRSV